MGGGGCAQFWKFPPTPTVLLAENANSLGGGGSAPVMAEKISLC